jgi:hypothetical protein
MDPLSGARACLRRSLPPVSRNLYDFWSSIEDAPQEIRAIARDVHLIEGILEEIDVEEEHHLFQRTTRTALQQCAESVQDLISLGVDLEPGFASSKRRIRKWSGLKAIFRKGKNQKNSRLSSRDEAFPLVVFAKVFVLSSEFIGNLGHILMCLFFLPGEALMNSMSKFLNSCRHYTLVRSQEQAIPIIQRKSFRWWHNI